MPINAAQSCIFTISLLVLIFQFISSLKYQTCRCVLKHWDASRLTLTLKIMALFANQRCTKLHFHNISSGAIFLKVQPSFFKLFYCINILSKHRISASRLTLTLKIMDLFANQRCTKLQFRNISTGAIISIYIQPYQTRRCILKHGDGFPPGFKNHWHTYASH